MLRILAAALAMCSTARAADLISPDATVPGFTSMTTSSPPAPASACPGEKYLDSGADATMANVTGRNQLGLGICYAETAAQMVDAWRFSHGSKNYKHQTSSVYAAAGLKARTEDYTVDAGMPCDAARHILGPAPVGGSCDAAVVRADYGGRTYAQFLKELEAKWSWYQSAMTYPAGTETNLKLGNIVGELAAKLEKLGFGSAAPPVNELHALLSLKNPTDYLRGVLAYKCKGNSVFWPPAYKCKEYWKWSEPDENWLWMINRHLSAEKNPQPIAILFCGQFLQSWDGYVGIDRKHGTQNADCGRHAALIIGRRTNKKTGACEFLIRNSWGSKCSQWASTKYFECDRGTNVWVQQKDLARNIYGISYLEAP